ncbi:MAG: hypothetical protein ACFFG0_44450, partial [Candidatus Thorarchaeota archaeon]
KDRVYEVILNLGAFKKYTISNIKNPIEPITHIQVKINEKFEGERISSDRIYELEKGDRIKITENIRHTKAATQNGNEFEINLCQIIWKDGKQFDDLSNYYFWTIFKGEKKIKPFVPTKLPQVTLISEMLTKVDLQVSDNYKESIILKIENVPLKIKNGSSELKQPHRISLPKKK